MSELDDRIEVMYRGDTVSLVLDNRVTHSAVVGAHVMF